MQAGLLRKRARFDALTRVSDGAGGATEGWETFITVWAQFSPERGRERIQAGRLESASAGVLRIRSSTQARQITGKHRVVFDGMTYNIKGDPTNPDGRNVMLEMTLEGVPV